jgi:hypothetical protein
MKRKDVLFLFFTLLLLLAFILPASPGFAQGSPVTVYNTAELKKALKNPAGSNVRLGANITFPADLQKDYAVEITKGTHVLDLNGFTIEYSFINRAREHSGTPIVIREGKLTINGEGAIIGGTIAIEIGGDSLLTINGGNYSGAAHSALRIQGVAVLNGGTVTGRFGDVWLEGGILVDNAGIVKKIDYTFNVPSAIIRNGVLKGNAELLTTLALKDLDIPEGSSLTIRKNGILSVDGTLKGEERIKVEEGAVIKKGVAVCKENIRLWDNLTLNQLTVEPMVKVLLDEGMRLTVKGDLNNKGRIDIRSGSMLVVEGDLINSGEVSFQETDDLLVKGNIIDSGTVSDPDPDAGTSPADRLYTLGLFQGTGTDAEGKPVYDLHIKPTRQVAITMLVRLLGKEKEALSSPVDHPFTDVDAWASPYVGYAYANGLTKGISDMEFGSHDLLTANQYITFILRALGYSDVLGDFRWDKPTELSEKIGLTGDAYKNNSAPFFRGDVVVISESALRTKMKNSDVNLLQHLLDNKAVKFEDIIKAGLGHLVDF